MGDKKVALRHREIVSMVNEQETLYLEDFVQRLSCSESTIRNDLRLLEQKGLLRRVFGGATRASLLSLSVRSSKNKAAKMAIAAYAFERFIRPGLTVTLDTGSSVMELAQKILEADIPLTVITPSFHVATILVGAKQVELNLVGGKYDRYTGGFYDENTNPVLRTMHSDLYFMSAKVACPVGFTIGTDGEVSIRQTMIACSSKTMALIDSSKIGGVNFKVVCGFDEVDTIITDDKADKAAVRELEKTGVQVCCAPL